MGRKAKVSDVDIPKIIKLYWEGHSYSSIEKILGCTRKSIPGILEKAGITLREQKFNHQKRSQVIKTSRGYLYEYCPGHPRTIENVSVYKDYVAQHTLIMEKHLGRYLAYYGESDPKTEIVHHKNRNRSDNSLENLEVMTNEEHWHLHKDDRNSKIQKKVRCLNTGEEFQSAAEAARSMGLEYHSVSVAIRKGYRSGGKRWEYCD
ncbi:HNH endonuclease [Microcoleus sp. S13_C3]